MNWENELRKQEVDEVINNLKEKIACAPAGTLTCQKMGDGFQYYRVTYENGKRKREYIREKDRHLAVELARKRVYKALLADYERERRALNAFLKNYGDAPGRTEAVLKQSEGLRKLILEECQEWGVANRPTSHIYPGSLKHEAPNGERVRSKGEADIYWDLYDELLPVVYEKVLYLGNELVRPDFVIKHPITGEEIIWEHFPLSRRRIQQEIQYYFGDWIKVNGHRKK